MNLAPSTFAHLREPICHLCKPNCFTWVGKLFYYCKSDFISSSASPVYFATTPVGMLSAIMLRAIANSRLLPLRGPHHPLHVLLLLVLHAVSFAPRQPCRGPVVGSCWLVPLSGSGSIALRKLIMSSLCSPKTFQNVRSALGSRYIAMADFVLIYCGRNTDIAKL